MSYRGSVTSSSRFSRVSIRLFNSSSRN